MDKIKEQYRNTERACPKFDSATRDIYNLNKTSNISIIEYDQITLPKSRRGSTRISERLFFNFIRSYAIDNILEIGSMDGRHTIRFLNETDAHIHTFEPNISSIPYFSEMVKEPRLNLNMYGLSDKNGISSFNIVTEHDNIKMPTVNGMSSFEDIVEVNSESTRICATHCKGSDYLLTSGISKQTNGLWIDVEGHSVSVLAGFGDLLNDISIVVCEVEIQNRYSSGATADRVISILEKAGHKIIYRDFQYFGIFNVVSINKEKYDNELRNILAPAENYINIIHNKYSKKT